MRCRKAKRLIMLYAGGDLPEKRTGSLMEHLNGCASCRAEMEQVRQIFSAVGNAVFNDKPESLPADFTQRVVKNTPRKPARTGRPFVRSARYAFAASVVIVGFLLGTIYMKKSFDRKYSAGEILQDLHTLDANGASLVKWEDSPVFTKYFTRPVRFLSWSPPEKENGIFVIMHKATGSDGKQRFVFDYIGQSRDYSFSSFPWFYHKMKKLTEISGSEDNIYIAVCPLPESTLTERLQIEKVMQRKYNSLISKGV